MSYQDLQITALLADSVNYMTTDTDIISLYSGDNEIISSVLARDPVVPGSAQTYRIQAGSPPIFCMWRNGGMRERDELSNATTIASVEVVWLDRLPGTGTSKDKIEMIRNKADNIVHVFFHGIETVIDRRPAYVDAAGIIAAMPVRYEQYGDWSSNLLGFRATLLVEHCIPPYAVADLAELTELTVNLQLYKSVEDSTDYDIDAVEDLT